jgi:putative transposase
MAAEGHQVQLCCRLLGVAESGYYEWLKRPPCMRSLRHVSLTELIRQVHIASRGTYGSRRVTAELVLGRGISVGHGQVELLMARAGLAGLPGRRRWRHAKPDTYVTSAAVGEASMDQPTTRREYVSSTTAQYTFPSRTAVHRKAPRCRK